MKGYNHTKKVTAAALLLLFFFGTTPKLFLHYLVADHRDTSLFSSSYNQQLPEKQIIKEIIDCHCDSTVIESPFVDYALQLSTSKPTSFTLLLSNYFTSHTSPHFSYFALRGPPAPLYPLA